jgi:hypothetical protein
VGRHPWATRPVVEDCIPLPISGFRQCVASEGGMLTWTTAAGGEELARLEYRVGEGGMIYLIPRWGLDNFTGQTIRTTTTRPLWGGQRLWWQCWCGRRAGRLYLPPGCRQFACRHCHNLTYLSSRRHDPRESRRRAAWRAEIRAEFDLLTALCLPHDLEELIKAREQAGLEVGTLRDCLGSAQHDAEAVRAELLRNASRT